MYHINFNTLVDAAATLGDDNHPSGLRKAIMAKKNLADYDNLSAAQKASDNAHCNDRYLAILFLRGAKPNRFGTVLRDLNKDYSKTSTRSRNGPGCH